MYDNIDCDTSAGYSKLMHVGNMTHKIARMYVVYSDTQCKNITGSGVATDRQSGELWNQVIDSLYPDPVKRLKPCTSNLLPPFQWGTPPPPA
jgi:hypothetical protein